MQLQCKFIRCGVNMLISEQRVSSYTQGQFVTPAPLISAAWSAQHIKTPWYNKLIGTYQLT